MNKTEIASNRLIATADHLGGGGQADDYSEDAIVAGLGAPIQVGMPNGKGKASPNDTADSAGMRITALDNTQGQSRETRADT